MSSQDFKMENLKMLREKKGITQVRLSVEVEVSQELISQYELGKSKPTIDNLLKLANYFNCSTDFLLQRTNNPLIVKDLNKSEIEVNDIANKYKNLNVSKKKLLKSYLAFLELPISDI